MTPFERYFEIPCIEVSHTELTKEVLLELWAAPLNRLYYTKLKETFSFHRARGGAEKYISYKKGEIKGKGGGVLGVKVIPIIFISKLNT